MKLSEMKQWLDEHGVQLTKSLGQNFMHDQNQLRRMVQSAELNPQDRVLEIGPGLGPLTEFLLASAGEVMAIEVDQRLGAILQQRFGHQPGFSLIQDDAMQFLKREPRDWSDWKLVSNLPYSVGSAILVELAGNEKCPRRMVATLQMEVARRINSQAGDADYGLLSLLVQARYAPRNLFKIPSACFFPKPDVDSACITLERRPTPVVEAGHFATFVRLVKGGFSQRRKMMLKLLVKNWPKPRLLEAYQAAAVAETVRAEEVTLEQFGQMARVLGG